MSNLCGHRGFAGPSACILKRGHGGAHSYGNWNDALIREEREELESLRQQLASCQAALADTEALEIGTGERLAKVEQQLAAAIAACKLKDESIEAAHNGLRWWMDAFPLHVTEADNEEMLKLVKALTIHPDDSALKAWLEMSNTADCRSQSSLQGVVK
jgi:hypothetical protein